MLSNLLAFPAVVVLLAVGQAITTNFGKQAANTATGFVPPLLGAGTQQAAQAFVGLGILLTIPKVVNILQETLKAPPFKYGTAWSEAMTAAAAGTQILTRPVTSRVGAAVQRRAGEVVTSTREYIENRP